MKHSLYICFFTVLMFGYTNISAQQELSLYFQRQLVQSNNLNPAFGPERTMIAFPSIAFNYGNSAFTYNQLFKKSGSKRKLNLDEVIGQMDERNIITTQLAFDFFAASIQMKSVLLTFRISQKMTTDLSYSDELIQLGWRGNAQFIGQEIQVAPRLDFSVYREYGVGASYKIGNLTLGQRVKFLAGGLHVSTSNEKADIYTDSEYYQTTIETNYQINSSGLQNFDIDQISPLGDFKNPGFAVDLGASYQLDDDWSFSASVINLGAIYWREDIENFNLSGEIDFQGLELDQYFEVDTFNFAEYTDSLENQFVSGTSDGNFTQALVPEVYIGGKRRITDRQEVGMMLYARVFNKIQPAITAYYGMKVGESINIGTTYSMRNKNLNNIGLTYIQEIMQAQVFFSTDNVFNLVMPRRSRNLNFRVGVNMRVPEKSRVHRRRPGTGRA